MGTTLVIGLVLLICLTVTAADQERIVMGPYVVSFDPGQTGNYTVYISPTVNDVGFAGTPYTRYSMTVYKGTDLVSTRYYSTIQVIKYRAPVSSDYLKSITEHDLKKFVPLGYSEPLIMDRMIDNTSGIVGRCSTLLHDTIFPSGTVIEARYLLTPNENGTSCDVVFIAGTDQRINQGTESIIDTIHVEKTRLG